MSPLPLPEQHRVSGLRLEGGLVQILQFLQVPGQIPDLIRPAVEGEGDHRPVSGVQNDAVVDPHTFVVWGAGREIPGPQAAGIAELDPSDGLPALLRHPEQDLQAGVIPAQIFHVESRLHLLDADIL